MDRRMADTEDTKNLRDAAASACEPLAAPPAPPLPLSSPSLLHFLIRSLSLTLAVARVYLCALTTALLAASLAPQLTVRSIIQPSQNVDTIVRASLPFRASPVVVAVSAKLRSSTANVIAVQLRMLSLPGNCSIAAGT